MSGRLIVIEGLDGSGKATQTELLFKKLSASGEQTVAVTFPDYESPSSSLVRMYLSGELGESAQDVNAYAAASFYAVDRFASFKKNWGKDYLSGKTILADRYTTSNAIYQLAKLPKTEWDSFLDWMYDYEYNLLRLPKPHIVIYLDMSPDVSQKLLLKRYCGDSGKKDLHEKNLDFLKSCRQSALYSADKLGWHIIRCCDGAAPLNIDVIAEKIEKLIIKG